MPEHKTLDHHRAAPTPPHHAVRDELTRVLTSAAFGGSSRKCAFLSYVVTQALAGYGARTTAYDIAIHVFGRDERFDPQADPLVRIAARRVRDALDQYYLSNGRNDPVRISIPKGHYVPVFQSAGSDAAAASRAATGNAVSPRMGARLRLAALVMMVVLPLGGALVLEDYRLPPRDGAVSVPAAGTTAQRIRLAVTPIRNFADNARLEGLASAVTEQLQGSLCCGPNFERAIDLDGADLFLEGSVHPRGSDVQVQLLLRSGATARIIWTNSYVLDLDPRAGHIDTDLAMRVAQELSSMASLRAGLSARMY